MNIKRLFVFTVFMSAIQVLAQVPSVIYSGKPNAYDHYPQFYQLKSLTPEIIMPYVDVNVLLEEDKAAAGKDVPYRFGKGFDVVCAG